MKDSPGKELSLSHHLIVDLTSLKSGWVGGMGKGKEQKEGRRNQDYYVKINKYIPVCVYADYDLNGNGGAYRVQRCHIPPQLELKVVVSSHMCVFGIESRSCVRTACAFNC